MAWANKSSRDSTYRNLKQIYQAMVLYIAKYVFASDPVNVASNIAKSSSVWILYTNSKPQPNTREPKQGWTLSIVVGLNYITWPLITKRTDVLPQYHVKSRSLYIRVNTFPIALKFNKHLGSSSVAIPVKFQSDKITMTSNLAASRLHDICR